MTPSFKSNLNKKKSHLQLLMRLAMADKALRREEEEFISYVAQRLGLTKGDIEEARQNLKVQAFEMPKSEQERMNYLYHLLFLMKIDGSVNKEERNLCLLLGVRLGINPQLVEELIGVMGEYAGKPIPEGLMLEVVKKYLN